ncbi:MAG: enoyl-CoA hydratase/isomerase family protein [Acidobacteriia bacterium]|nr:enoyl-CoA hydratase/isomerase family protein [Terriglobia bacterium]
MPDKVRTEFLHSREVVRITLNAPKANILDSHMMGELRGELASLAQEPQIKLVQLTGAGDHFSFGASVQEHARDQAARMLEQFHGIFYQLIDLAVPTAALVSGQCLGGGLELALMCNFLILDETAKLGQPEISLAVFPPPASLILPLKLGQARADELLLTGRSVSAAEAVALGMACQSYESRAAMLAGVDAWIEKQILPKSASSLRIAVKAGRHMFNDVLRERLKDLERVYVSELMATHDANEGIAAFLERRPPVWENR